MLAQSLVRKKYTSDQQYWLAESTRLAQEKIHGIRTVRSYGHEKYESDNYSKIARTIQDKTELSEEIICQT